MDFQTSMTVICYVLIKLMLNFLALQNIFVLHRAQLKGLLKNYHLVESITLKLLYRQRYSTVL